jgi:micrococcal nuclease
MKFLKPILTLASMVGAVYLLYTYVIFPFFSHYAKVIHVVDADTLLVKDGEKVMQVQLIGVDAPEKTGPGKYSQCFDDEARHLAVESFFVKSQDVRLIQDDLLNDKDAGGRYLRYVYLRNGDLINEKLLRQGLAKQYADPTQKYQKMEQFGKDQEEARSKNIGIWDPQGCNGNFG